jgi:uncharacterized membrane protein YdfJ with MMPL/SSD domain
VSKLEPEVIGYYTGCAKVGLSPENSILKSGYVSEDERTTAVVLFATQSLYTLEWWDTREQAMGFLNEFVDDPPVGVKVMITGNPSIYYEEQHLGPTNLLHAEGCLVVPATLVLWYIVRNLRLLLIPLVSLVVSFLTATIFVLPITNVMPAFSADVPPAMVSVVIALSLDYSLFLLTRFNESQKMNYNLQKNIDVLLENTAHTIGVSGSLIVVAFCGAVMVQSENLQVAGVCLGATTAACMVVNATLTPALLLCFGRLLTLPIDCSRGKQSSMPLNVARPTSVSGWHRLMWAIERSPCTAIVAVFVVFAPLLFMVRNLHITADSYALLPEDLNSMKGLHVLDASGIPMGHFEPYMVVVSTMLDPPRTQRMGTPGISAPSAMATEKGFEVMLDLADEMKNVGGVAGVVGPVMMYHKRMTWHDAHAMQHPVLGVGEDVETYRHLYLAVLASHFSTKEDYKCAPWPTPFVHSGPVAMKKRCESGNDFQDGLQYKFNGARKTNESVCGDCWCCRRSKEEAAVLELHTKFAPRGPGAVDWVLKIREELFEWEKRNPDYRATLSGGATKGADTRVRVVGSMQAYIATVVLGVMLLVFVLFRSIVLPIRLAFALLFTLAATFGMGVVIYQTSLLHGLCPWLRFYDGLTFECVPIATCIAVALGLDYDIFLITRIVEFRNQGFSDRDSIIQAVAKTGGVISGAGVIMSIAFSGLLMSPKLMQQQFALLLITSVLLDTFVVRTVLVPALMLRAQGYNWWPRDMPVQKFHEGFELVVSAEPPRPSSKDGLQREQVIRDIGQRSEP